MNPSGVKPANISDFLLPPASKLAILRIELGMSLLSLLFIPNITPFSQSVPKRSILNAGLTF